MTRDEYIRCQVFAFASVCLAMVEACQRHVNDGDDALHDEVTASLDVARMELSGVVRSLEKSLLDLDR